MSEENGKLAAGWQSVRLGDVCQVIMGQSPLGSSYNANGCGEPLLNGPTEFGEQFPTAVQWTTAPTKFCEPGDILLCVRGATTGRKNIADRHYCIGRGLAAIRGIDNLAATEFLWFALDIVTQKLLKETAGSTFPNLPADKLERVRIPLPRLDEQRRIAAGLRDGLTVVSQARDALEAQLSDAESLSAAHLRAVFESPEVDQSPRTFLKEVILETRNGLYKPDSFYGRGTRILKMFNIGRLDGTWNLTRVALIDTTPEELKLYQLARGDILFNRVNSRELVGKCSVIDARTAGAVYESKNIRLRIRSDRVLPNWIALWLNSAFGRAQIENKMKQAIGQATINRSDLDSLVVPIPAIPIQRKLVARLDAEFFASSELQQTLSARLAEVEKVPTALLRAAFQSPS